MSISTRSSLAALALIAMAAAVPQTTAAADRGCKDTGATSALSAQLKASTSRTAVMAQRTPAGRLVAKPCDDKKTAVQKAPGKFQAKPAQPAQPTRLKVKLKKKFGNKMTESTAPAGPRKPGGKTIGAKDDNPGGGPVRPAGDKAAEPASEGYVQFAVTPGQTAYVPMVHGACGNGDPDCMKHVLANTNGSVNVHGTLKGHCPAGQKLTKLLAMKHYNVPEVDYFQGSPQQTYAVQVEVEFTHWASVELEGNAALGGTWWEGGPEGDPSPSQTVQGTIEGSLYLVGYCDGGAELAETVEIAIPATFHNLDYPHSVRPSGAQVKTLGN